MIIEKIKSKIEAFRYEDAKLLIEKIEESSFEYKIKKAGFYKQISENKKADKILYECSAELAQMKLPEDLYSSYLGYLNLCYRSGIWNISNEYSDLNYYENEYNTQRIIVKQREQLAQDFFKSDCEEKKDIPFNLNTGQKNFYIIRSNSLYKKCFNFLITLDKLCLPIFGDQAELIPRAINEVIDTSKSKYWKISLAIRANSEKVVNQLFTRKVIETVFKEDIKNIFKLLFDLAKLYKPDDPYEIKKYIVSKKNILNILSRMVVFLSDKDVVRYIKLLSESSQKNEKFIVNDITKIISRISTRFNNKIAALCQSVMFMDFGYQHHLCSYFVDFSFEIDQDNIDKYYNNAISLIKQEDATKRDCGVSQLLILWKNFEINDYKQDIIDALWKDNCDVLPSSNLFLEFVWEELPHPNSIEFSKLYYSYLLKGRYVRSVTDSGYGGKNSASSLYSYLNFFYSTSKISMTKCEKVILDETLASFMVNKAYEYINNEKILLEHKSIFLDEKYDCETKLDFLGDLIALVYIESVTEGIIESVRDKIVSIKDILVTHNIFTDSLNMVAAIENRDFNLCMDIFENVILSKNKKRYSSAFIGIHCLIFYLESQPEVDYDLNKSFEKYMGAINYLDIKYAKTIWMEMEGLLKHSIFINENAQKYITRTIQKCLDIYIVPAQDGERYYLDGLYNCVKTLSEYYKGILEAKVVVTNELKKCVDMAKNIENYEIKNIWDSLGCV